MSSSTAYNNNNKAKRLPPPDSLGKSDSVALLEMGHKEQNGSSPKDHNKNSRRKESLDISPSPPSSPSKSTSSKNSPKDIISNEAQALNENLTDFAENTTLHGLQNAFLSTSKWDKFFWTVILIVVVAVVVFQLQKLIRYFLENPTVTSINVVYPDRGLAFPSLTVCILTKLNKTVLKERYPKMPKRVAEFSMASFVSAYSTALMDIGYFYMQNLTTQGLQNELDEHLDGKDILQFLEEVSFHCRDQFLLCWFENGQIFDCCDPDAALRVKRHLLHSGPCFEFQSETLLQRLPGPVGGFGFAYWYPNNDLFPSVFNSYDEHAVHMFTSPTEAMLEMNPVVLPVGAHVHISLQAKKTTKLDTDQLGRPTCLEKTLRFFNYSYASCQAECLIQNMLNLCNCTGITTYGKIPQDQICSPKDSFECYERLAFNFTDILSECRTKNCTEACTYWSYKTSATTGKSFNPLLEKEMVEYWRLPITSSPNQSLIFVDVYFSDIEYQDVQQMAAFNIETFVSSIGGAMGLWTGASIVTWIHLVYFCLSGSCRKKAREKQKNTNVQSGGECNGEQLNSSSSCAQTVVHNNVQENNFEETII